jgi:hypothetical protein
LIQRRELSNLTETPTDAILPKEPNRKRTMYSNSVKSYEEVFGPFVQRVFRTPCMMDSYYSITAFRVSKQKNLSEYLLQELLPRAVK